MSNTIKISFAPLFFFFVLIAVAITVGFVWDSVRTANKLKLLEQKVEVIYKSHTTEFLEIVVFNDVYRAKLLLANINIPEKNIYYVSVLRKTPQGLALVYNEYMYSYPPRYENYQEITFSYEDDERIKKVLSDSKTTTAKEVLFRNVWNDEANLYAFTPIKNGQETVGWVVLRLPKTTDI